MLVERERFLAQHMHTSRKRRGDLRRMLEKGTNWNGMKVLDIMTPAPKTIGADALAVEALEILQHHSITQLVVTDGERYIGIVHLHDLVREGLH